MREWGEGVQVGTKKEVTEKAGRAGVTAGQQAAGPEVVDLEEWQGTQRMTKWMNCDTAKNFQHCYFPLYARIPKRCMPYLTLLVKSLISEIRHDWFPIQSLHQSSLFPQIGQISFPLDGKSFWQFQHLCSLCSVAIKAASCAAGGTGRRLENRHKKTQTEKLG